MVFIVIIAILLREEGFSMSESICPICGKPMKVTEDHLEHVLTESTSTCEDGCQLYQEDFAYGYTRLRIGHFEVGYDYTLTQTENAKLSDMVSQVIGMYRVEFLKETEATESGLGFIRGQRRNQDFIEDYCDMSREELDAILDPLVSKDN